MEVELAIRIAYCKVDAQKDRQSLSLPVSFRARPLQVRGLPEIQPWGVAEARPCQDALQDSLSQLISAYLQRDTGQQVQFLRDRSLVEHVHTTVRNSTGPIRWTCLRFIDTPGNLVTRDQDLYQPIVARL